MVPVLEKHRSYFGKSQVILDCLEIQVTEMLDAEDVCRE
jgi:hypothetical protein